MYLMLLLTFISAVMVTARPTEVIQDQPGTDLVTRDLAGYMTYYGTGQGACGMVSTESDMIVSISHITYDASNVGTDSNLNPLCGKQIQASFGSNTAVLTVVDRCSSCQPADIDVSEAAFTALVGDLGPGNVTVTWNWVD